MTHTNSQMSPDVVTPPLSPFRVTVSSTSDVVSGVTDGPVGSTYSSPYSDTAATVRVNEEVTALLRRMVDDEPTLPETEAFFRCHAKRRLYKALKQAAIRPVAEWLFLAPRHMFHMLVPRPSFQDAVAILGKVAHIQSEQEQSRVSEVSTDQTSRITDLDVIGRKILFVPVTIVRGRILGYTFSGCNCKTSRIDNNSDEVKYHIATYGEYNRNHGPGRNGGGDSGICLGFDETRASCPMGAPQSAFMPHGVGRFSFDASLSDLLIVAHGLVCDTTGIMHMRNGRDGDPPAGAVDMRDRAWFAVPTADYSFRRLPGRVMGMLSIPERRLYSHPRFQFPPPPLPLPDTSMTMRDGMAALERLVKGRFICDRVCKDKMDPISGQMVSRTTFTAQFEFDAEDAISVNVFKDLAIRLYYSYISTSDDTETTVPSLQH